MMRRLLSSLPVLGLLVLFASLPAASAGQVFTNADVRGPYGFAFDGTIVGVGPLAAVGLFVADGDGNLTDGVRTLNVAGAVFHQTFTCTYSVNANGTGSATCSIVTGGVGTEHFDFVLTDKRREAPFIGTDPGVVVRGAAVKQ